MLLTTTHIQPSVADQNLLNYSQHQIGTCSSCISQNEFNADLFLEQLHIEKKNTAIVSDKFSPGLTEAWWID